MRNVVVLIKNSGEHTLELLIEPYVHLYKIAPGLSVTVSLEDHPSDEPVEVEYLATGVTLYTGGAATVSSDGQVIAPQFLE
jgi:hypothetical protein